MPTSCVPKARCGAYAPGWMDGTHPTVVDGKVTRRVCYHDYTNCCEYANNIMVCKLWTILRVQIKSFSTLLFEILWIR